MTKQIEFPEKQTHRKSFEQLCLLLAGAGIVFCLIVVATVA